MAGSANFHAICAETPVCPAERRFMFAVRMSFQINCMELAKFNHSDIIQNYCHTIGCQQ